MCCNRAFRPANSIEKYFCETRFGTIKSVPPSPPIDCECGGQYCPGEKPYTAEELRKIKEVLDQNRAAIESRKIYLEWCERCNDAAEEQYRKEIAEAQEAIRKHIDQKRAAKLAIAAMEDEAWVFEKSANGWI